MLEPWPGTYDLLYVLGLFTLIGAVVILFFLGIGAYYLFINLSGPRKIEEIEALIKKGQIPAAIFELDKILEKDDRNFRARYLMGMARHRSGDFGAAVIEFRQAMKIARWTPDVTEVVVRRALAESLLEAGKINEAKNEYLVLSQQDSRNYNVFYQLGRLFQQGNVLDKAVGFLKKATELNPRHGESFAVLGQCLYGMKAYQDARAALVQAVQISPDNRQANYYLGLTLRYLGDHEWALKELEKAEKEDELRVRAIMAKGMLLIDMENYTRAITELDRGTKFAKPMTDQWFNLRYLLATAAEKNKDMRVAIENWEQIEGLKPGFRDVREKLKQYADFRVDDSIKDFMIANNNEFENLCRKMLEAMHFTVSSITLKNEATVHAIGLDEENRRTGKNRTQFLILRDMEPLGENRVREFQESMRSNNASRGVILTTGDISSSALDFASSRPIDLLDTMKMVQYLKAAKKK